MTWPGRLHNEINSLKEMDCAIDHDEIKDILISKRALWLSGVNTIEYLRAEIDRKFC